MFKNRLLLFVFAIVLAGILPLASCFSQSQGSAYYDAGAQDLTVTGQQMGQYVVYRFDTNSAGRGMSLPSAADIITQIGSPEVGQIFIMAVSADGANQVTITGGSGVTVKASAATVAGNSTKNLYFVIMSSTADSQAITVY
jgi:hypothetical protein